MVGSWEFIQPVPMLPLALLSISRFLYKDYEIRIIDHFSHLDKGRIRSSGSPAEVLAGSGRTLPMRYLPDHLVLQEELHTQKGLTGRLDLDPGSVEKKLMSVIPERIKE